MRQFLITRPADKTNALGQMLTKAGFSLTLYPLLTPAYDAITPEDRRVIDNATDYIITSRRAIHDPSLPKKPLWCVGTPPPDWPVGGSAENSAALTRLLNTALPVGRRPVYLRGTDISKPLALPDLPEVITYTMRETPLAPLPAGDYWGAAVFSLRSARLLSMRCSAATRLERVFCLSPAVAEGIHSSRATTLSANSPSLLSLIACIETQLNTDAV